MTASSKKQGSETLSKTPELKSLLEAEKIRTYMHKVESTTERNILQCVIQRNETKREILT